ncbi:MAG: helix-turn-helix transcriptional regulator [Elainellaceae cyanobacterium]
MKLSEAFKETMFRFNLNGNALADKSGLTPSQISNFRNGSINLRTNSLEKLLAAMPYEARSYFFSLAQDDPTGEGETGHNP